MLRTLALALLLAAPALADTNYVNANGYTLGNDGTLARFADALRGVVSQRLLPRKGSTQMRVLCTEVLINNYATKEAIRDPARHKAITSILERSADQGMHTFDQSLTTLVAAGVVDVEVAASVASSPTNFRRGLQVQGIRDVA
jgi:twitching motility protein PilT